MEYIIRQIKEKTEIEELQKEADLENKKAIGITREGKLYVYEQGVKEINSNNLFTNKPIREAEKGEQKYYVSVCLIIRDENEYLKEWIAHYFDLGVEHLYIYDNGATFAPVGRVIKKMPIAQRKKITIINWIDKYEHTQHEAYNHCIKTYGEESKWIGFFDADEYVRIKDTKKTINEFLKEYEEYGALHISWIMYNAGGEVRKKEKPLKERFTKPMEEWIEKGLGKVFVQPAKTIKMFTHSARLKEGQKMVNEEYEEDNNNFRNKYSVNLIAIDHYYTKSYEEWCQKIKRGVPDPMYRRRYDDFFEYNKDLKYLYNPKMKKRQRYN